ncbi:MAG TPA: PAS domain S-box protein [Herpetosiphonaceae bacterium]
MDNQAPPASDPRIAAILGTLSQIRAGDWSARAAGTGQGDPLDQIIDQLNQLAEALASQHMLWAENERRFEELLDVISGMAALDFTRKASVGEEGSIMDAIAFGLNELNNELAVSTVSREYVDNIIESMLDALIVVDERGIIRTINRAALRLFGYKEQAFIAQPITMLFADAQGTANVLNTITGQAEARTIETTCRTADGRVFPVALSASAMRSADKVQGAVCTVRDITERRKAEEALRRSIVQEETIRAQAAILAELSTPLIPISDQVVVMPLIGSVDSQRAQQVLESLLQGIASMRAEIAILDITGVPVVDTQVANALIQAAQAVKLLGAQVILTGIRPEVAQTLVGLDINLRDIMTHSTLQSGIAAVLGNER